MFRRMMGVEVLRSDFMRYATVMQPNLALDQYNGCCTMMKINTFLARRDV